MTPRGRTIDATIVSVARETPSQEIFKCHTSSPAMG